jgi:hypothetical protein
VGDLQAQEKNSLKTLSLMLVASKLMACTITCFMMTQLPWMDYCVGKPFSCHEYHSNTNLSRNMTFTSSCLHEITTIYRPAFYHWLIKTTATGLCYSYRSLPVMRQVGWDVNTQQAKSLPIMLTKAEGLCMQVKSSTIATED